MLYTEFQTNENIYKLRLDTRNLVTLEKLIKCNPLSIFGNGDEVPEVTVMVSILYTSLQHFQHGITLDKTYDIFDEYLEDHSVTDFLAVIIDIYKVSGLIPNDKKEKN